MTSIKAIITRAILSLAIFISATACQATAATQIAPDTAEPAGRPTASLAPAQVPANDATACPQPFPKMEITSKEVNLFTRSKSIPQQVIDCFQQVYGIKLNLDNFSSQKEMYDKLSQGTSGYDVVQPADNMLQLLSQQGMLAKLDLFKLSVIGNFSSEYLNPPFDPGNQYSLPYQLGSSGIAYNADTVKKIPSSYADLWDQEYAGKLVMLDDPRNIIGMTLLSLGFDVNSTEPAQLAKAKARLAELALNVRIFDSDSPKTALIAGNAALGVIWATEASAARAGKGSIQYVYPKEGVILWQDNFAITAGATHSDAAYAWLNYLYQPDVFWMVMRDIPGTNPESAAIAYAKTNHPEVYNAYMSSNITNIPTDVVKKGHWLQDLGDATPLYDQIWSEVKGK